MARTVILRDARGERRALVDNEGYVSIDIEEAGLTGTTVNTATPVVAVAPGVVRVGEGAGRTAWVAAAGDVRWVYLDGDVFEIDVLRAGSRRRGGSGQGSLSAPMPATVVRVDVAPGATVRRGDTLIILEAMKMELPIRASSDGVVTAIHCRAGELVQPGVSLVDIE
jgi:biotin carboxyl carrier protein